MTSKEPRCRGRPPGSVTPSCKNSGCAAVRRRLQYSQRELARVRLRLHQLLSARPPTASVTTQTGEPGVAQAPHFRPVKKRPFPAIEQQGANPDASPSIQVTGEPLAKEPGEKDLIYSRRLRSGRCRLPVPGTAGMTVRCVDSASVDDTVEIHLKKEPLIGNSDGGGNSSDEMVPDTEPTVKDEHFLETYTGTVVSDNDFAEANDDTDSEDWAQVEERKKRSKKEKAEKIPKRRGRPPKTDGPTIRALRALKREQRMEQHTCWQCSAKFLSFRLLEQHAASEHPGTGAYRCTDCGQTFEQLTKLKVHTRSVHLKLKPFLCELCGKSFGAKEGLKSHKRSHLGERPHVCSICGKAFVTPNGLKLHEAGVHRGERPHVCGHCGKRFSQSTYMRAHERAVHMGELPHECSDCGKRFAWREHLRRHSLFHSGVRPFVCGQCGVRFTLRQALRKHVLIHTGERPHACDICNWRFTDSSNLIAHRRTHTDVKPFPCTICGQNFRRRSTLHKHQQRAHKPQALSAQPEQVAPQPPSSMAPGPFQVPAHTTTTGSTSGQNFRRRSTLQKHQQRAHKPQALSAQPEQVEPQPLSSTAPRPFQALSAQPEQVVPQPPSSTVAGPFQALSAQPEQVAAQPLSSTAPGPFQAPAHTTTTGSRVETICTTVSWTEIWESTSPAGSQNSS